MKYTIDQTFRCESLTFFREVYFSEAFNQAVARDLGLKERTLLEERVGDDGRRKRRVRMVPAVQLPAAIQALIGDHELSYDEVSVYDPANDEVEYFIDSAARERLTVRGNIRFSAAPRGVRRVIEGEVSAKVFGLGGVIERLVQSEVEKSYERIARFMQRYLDEAEATVA